ncbi:hypothetical protein ACAW74_26085 [Fibrella sp. WM1]|uniref:hypothetical protein n=1 Tax=Fibrella musci TaxID=3242485 RepID=UPI003520706E
MVRFEKDKLIIEIATNGHSPQMIYNQLVDSLLQVSWFALHEDKDDVLRTEAGILIYYLLNALLMKGQPDANRQHPTA